MYESFVIASHLVSGLLQGTACIIPFPGAFTVLIVLVFYNQHRHLYAHSAIHLNEWHPDILHSTSPTKSTTCQHCFHFFLVFGPCINLV